MTDEKDIIRRYTCAKGHKIEIRGGTWTALQLNYESVDGTVFQGEYNYCMACFGEWAQEKWPLKCEVIEAPERGSPAAAVSSFNVDHGEPDTHA